jgi:hypothetical protein
MNTYDLAAKKVTLKKVSSTHGGEYAGPCPACGGNDRFRVWPDQYQGKGGYWCRSCGKVGDNIQFLIDFEGMDFKAACAYLNITIDQHQMERPTTPVKQEFTPVKHQIPADLWQEKAENFITCAQQRLGENVEVVKWLAARGINAEAAVTARLGWNPGEDGKDIFRPRTAWGLPDLKKENGRSRMLWIPQGLIIPYSVDGIIQRIRVRRPEEHRTKENPYPYYVVPGSSMATMIIGAERRAFVIIESELDGIACAAAQDLAGSVSLGTLEGKPDAAAYAILKGALQILNALDYGDKGGGKKAAERAMKWWLDNFSDRCDRWPVPKGKDPGEAFQMGIDLEQWIEAGLPPVVTMLRRETLNVKGETKEAKHKTSSVKSEKDSSPLRGEDKGGGENIPPEGTPTLLAELYKLLRDNPAVKIINTPDRFTVLRNDRYVGGRINELVMRPGEVNDYLLSHPDQEITWVNLLNMNGEG